ncbi:hypothetical protein AKJ47_01205 [candidate division MSBL1 archaeon SCGC-AAA261G05]|uniref:Uncharacterized protein n=3 Tax=candidate division MSBL1 TaxID=215777 RepID=A0A133V0A8_9EURY|nr:hypothetical protein AKJ42_02280 [candidate division MSBL1 archaeon SCGC-AAA261C02]KXB03997.1 hypothetical protein AKJ47_01205 [candidate division MSBL1 archaeon SCGC-AAA261G05]KXB04848.1 hypothetical protein AKJ48_01200 [candidate division MSBL1 archaeon SCGC-AAA261O19]
MTSTTRRIGTQPLEEKLAPVNETTWKMIQERWNDIRSACPDRHDGRCVITGRVCTPESCPKLGRQVELSQFVEGQLEGRQAEDAGGEIAHWAGI